MCDHKTKTGRHCFSKPHTYDTRDTHTPQLRHNNNEKLFRFNVEKTTELHSTYSSYGSLAKRHDINYIWVHRLYKVSKETRLAVRQRLSRSRIARFSNRSREWRKRKVFFFLHTELREFFFYHARNLLQRLIVALTNTLYFVSVDVTHSHIHMNIVPRASQYSSWTMRLRYIL